MSLVVVEAPSRQDRGLRQFHDAVFLAGGITGCPDWQDGAIKLFKAMGSDLILYNPRRLNFPIHDRSAAGEQITWEHEHLRLADAVLYWFCADTIQPIVLFELGKWIATDKPIFLGVDPRYQRAQDVIIQTRLERPDIEIHDNLADLVEEVGKWERSKQP
jgi:hypothetical protein